MLKDLYKLAYDLDRKGQYDMAQEIEKVMESLAKRVGIDPKDMVSLADYFDSIGDTTLANHIDSLLEKVAKGKYKEHKGKEQKKPIKHRPKPPKAWLDKMVKEMMPNMKKRFKNISDKEAKRRATVAASDVWHNELSDSKVESILKKNKK